ncbi:hypothetical protein KKB84_08020 [bacterium]|nr:hypothetical protein [bacterium]
MVNGCLRWWLLVILTVTLVMPLGCAKRERESKQVKKEQINFFNEAMKNLEEAGVALNFRDLANYTKQDKVLTNPTKLIDSQKVDRAVKLLYQVLGISSDQVTGMSNIMAVEDPSGLSEVDLAYCYLELARLYVLKAAFIANSGANRFGVDLSSDGKYIFTTGGITATNINSQEAQGFIDMIYILLGLELKYKKGDTYLSTDIKDIYYPYKYEGSQGALALALKFVNLSGNVLPEDIVKALTQVKVYIEKFKSNVGGNIIPWGFEEVNLKIGGDNEKIYFMDNSFNLNLEEL